MGRRFPPEGVVTSVRGRNGAQDVVLTVAVPHGKSKRDVEVPLEPEFIIALAEAIQCCPQHIGETLPTGSSMDGTYRERWFPYVNLGHAIWHLENPDRVRPCLPRGSSIDVADRTALPPGDVIDVEADT